MRLKKLTGCPRDPQLCLDPLLRIFLVTWWPMGIEPEELG
jgi:hypothetical protein